MWLRIRCGFLLFILMGLTLYWYFLFFPYQLPPSELKKLAMSSAPAYVMLFVTLYLHMLNFLTKNEIKVAITDVRRTGDTIDFCLNITNNTNNNLTVRRLEFTEFIIRFVSTDIEKNSQSTLRIKPLKRSDISIEDLAKIDKFKTKVFIQSFGCNKLKQFKCYFKNPLK